LKPETLEMMFTFENGKGQYNMPALEYGLGVMRNQLAVGPDARGRARPATASTVLGHIGGFGGFRSALWYAPESGITIALGMNQGATDPNILATRVLQAVLASQGR
jgi:CubicO group peptidase (beta-lactamase class C family)